jgi:CTD nuclear envelope phosphatase 1
VLDLDETLIHSTSRPIPSQGGSSWLGLTSIGRRNKGAGHMIEVVLGGKSTLYHVYKRPFVDFFLRTVSPLQLYHGNSPCSQRYLPPGLWLVYARYIHGLDAGICRPSYRLARRGCGDFDPPVLP